MLKSDRRSWSDVEKELLETVFYAYEPGQVLHVKDLAAAGMLDSLSVVAIIEILAESGESDEALDAAVAEDFRSFARIRQLYERC